MPINVDVNDYKLNMNELSPINHQENIISMAHSGKQNLIKEQIKALQSSQISKAVEKAQANYLESLTAV